MTSEDATRAASPEPGLGERGTDARYAVGDWVRSEDGHITGEIVEVRRCGAEYLVRAPRVVIETSEQHLLSDEEIRCEVRVEDSHINMALEHLALTGGELVAAGLIEDMERAMAHALELVERHVRPLVRHRQDDGCGVCGSFSHHPSESCAGEVKGKQGVRESVVAEAELLAGAKYSVIRDDNGDYFTEYREGPRYRRDYRPSLDAALELFAAAVREHEDGDPAPTFEQDPAAVRYPLV